MQQNTDNMKRSVFAVMAVMLALVGFSSCSKEEINTKPEPLTLQQQQEIVANSLNTMTRAIMAGDVIPVISDAENVHGITFIFANDYMLYGAITLELNEEEQAIEGQIMLTEGIGAIRFGVKRAFILPEVWANFTFAGYDEPQASFDFKNWTVTSSYVGDVQFVNMFVSTILGGLDVDMLTELAQYMTGTEIESEEIQAAVDAANFLGAALTKIIETVETKNPEAIIYTVMSIYPSAVDSIKTIMAVLDMLEAAGIVL